LLYGIGPDDPVAYAVTAGAIVLVILGACYLPARRALRVDPVAALR
jgi:putative ABC transport system permease protein